MSPSPSDAVAPARAPGGARTRTLLIISQVYVPDPAGVGQYMAEVAAAMVRRGWRVVVLTSRRGYDDPRARYPRRERRDGVEVRRLPLSSFGKRSIPLRIVAGLLFLLQAVARGMFTRRLELILVSTSPPMCPAAALAIASVRRVPIKYWVMDLNPDQVVALGRLPSTAWSVRALEAFNRLILRRAADVIALDRFMAERLLQKRDIRSKLTVLPPWPQEDDLAPVPAAENPFRARQGLTGKFVLMYSGNHGPSNPLTTLLAAAARVRDVAELVFVFIGGGIGKREVEQAIANGGSNIRALPYQPLSEIRYSLSAADVHLVTVGDAVVGIVHPCKVYGAMAVARPLLVVGPDPCHASELVERFAIGWLAAHGDVEGVERTIRTIVATPRDELERMGRRAREAVDGALAKAALCGRFCDVLERGSR